MAFPFAAVGAGVAVIGLAKSIFGKSEEELTEEEIRKAEQLIQQYRQRALTEGVKNILSQTESGAADARTAAAARAMAGGRTGSDVEAYTIPAEGQVRRYGAEALTRFQTDTNRAYDEMAMSARLRGIGKPRSPNWGDYAQSIGLAGLRYGLSQPSTAEEPSSPPMTTPRDLLPPETFKPEPLPEGEFTMNEPSQAESPIYGDRWNFAQRPEQFSSLQYSPRLNRYGRLRRGEIFGYGG